MQIYSKNNHAKFRLDLISNGKALGFFNGRPLTRTEVERLLSYRLQVLCNAKAN